MKSMLSVVVFLGLIVLGTPSEAAPCAGSHGITGCGEPGDVSVQGGSSSGSGETGRVPALQLTTRSVPCGPNAADQLIAAGDPNADDDAITCVNAIKQCARDSKRLHQQGVAEVVIVKRAWGWAYVGTVCVATGPPQVTPGMVRARVVRLVPSAAIGLAPRGATLVNIQTVMWVDASRTRALAPLTILGQRVQVTLTLDYVDWSYGDGATGTSTGPGKAYDEQHDPCRAVRCTDYFGHMYRDTGSVHVAATAQWRASFTVAGGNAVRIPGTVAGPTGRADLTVKQARAVLVPNP